MTPLVKASAQGAFQYVDFKKSALIRADFDTGLADKNTGLSLQKLFQLCRCFT